MVKLSKVIQGKANFRPPPPLSFLSTTLLFKHPITVAIKPNYKELALRNPLSSPWNVQILKQYLLPLCTSLSIELTHKVPPPHPIIPGKPSLNWYRLTIVLGSALIIFGTSPHHEQACGAVGGRRAVALLRSLQLVRLRLPRVSVQLLLQLLPENRTGHFWSSKFQRLQSVFDCLIRDQYPFWWLRISKFICSSQVPTPHPTPHLHLLFFPPAIMTLMR